MSSQGIAAYCSGALGPGTIQSNLAAVQASGLEVVILWACHIGRPSIAGQQYGDLIYNDGTNLFVSGGAFNPSGSADIAAWPGQVAQLKQGASKVRRIYLSIGGGGTVEDFTTIQKMLQGGMADTLRANFQALRDAFTVDGVCQIDAIDLDVEETVDPSTIVGFSEILFELGFEVTFCPYIGPGTWQGYMQSLWNAGHKVTAWNLQCYSGGNGNLQNLAPWISALDAVVGKGKGAALLVPGLAVQGANDSYPQQCPRGSGGMCQDLAAVASDGLGGAFFWTFDWTLKNTQSCSGSVPTAGDYVSALQSGLNGSC